ncbi:glycerol-3-phosphate 1-O-acyltransferase PlsY [Enterococcus timonensis]|uniref:glycerol-3-phosphate 1-O-acyltransferase PlsY n=1 Tax=Enterococcus timonensis TaxID=1852364 RepID=UPI0008D8D75B|nr:glycerol-3-phosphate 1-O-acyltransferase PlsY [Enterococcus timonensis]
MKIFILLIVAYLIGSIPNGVWIGKLFFKKDLRDFGSGNMGTTNTFRVLGKKAGIVVFILDILKGTVATMIPIYFGLAINPLWFGLAAILGHTFPIFAGFKGGKAVATSGGILLGYYPPFFFFSLLLFIIILFLTSTVSLSSMITAVLVFVSTMILPLIAPVILPQQDWFLTGVIFLIALFIIIRHKDNIARIKNGTENRVPFGLFPKKK